MSASSFSKPVPYARTEGRLYEAVNFARCAAEWRIQFTHQCVTSVRNKRYVTLYEPHPTPLVDKTGQSASSRLRARGSRTEGNASRATPSAQASATGAAGRSHRSSSAGARCASLVASATGKSAPPHGRRWPTRKSKESAVKESAGALGAGQNHRTEPSAGRVLRTHQHSNSSRAVDKYLKGTPRLPTHIPPAAENLP